MKPENLLLPAAGHSELEGYSATLLLCNFMLNLNILLNLFPTYNTYFASHTKIIMRDLMFSQWCWYRFNYSAMLRCTDWQRITHVSKEHSAIIFMCWTPWPWIL